MASHLCDQCEKPTFESLVARVRGEYHEMPGLRLTFRQACRLWQIDEATCELLLEQLVRDGFLYRTEWPYLAANSEIT